MVEVCRDGWQAFQFSPLAVNLNPLFRPQIYRYIDNPMAHYATHRFNYWSQLAILAGLCGGGLLIGTVAMLIPLMGQVDVFNIQSSEALMEQLSRLPDATALLRWAQVIATPFIFLLPAWMYARICHIQPLKHFGFGQRVSLPQAAVVVLIMIAASPAVSALQELTEMLPWSKAALARFHQAEEAYNQQVAMMARMNGLQDYLLSLLIIALLPAVFEELMFRGCWQNLLSRWLKRPLLALVIISILFSAVHGSYLGFLSRFALGFILGWMYYRTGNIWLNIIAHFFNNAAAVTLLYFSARPGHKVDPSALDERFPLWMAVVSLLALVIFFIAFEKVSRQQIRQPGEEVLIPGYPSGNNPFVNDLASGQ